MLKIFFIKGIPFFRKFDIFHRQSTVLINVISVTFLLLNLSVLLPLGFKFDNLVIYVILMLFFPITHILKIFIFYIRKINIFKLFIILLFSYFLYSSLLLLSFVATISGLVGKKFSFYVTPKKKTRKFTFFAAISNNKWEVLIVLILSLVIVIMIVFYHKITVIALIWTIIAIFPLYLTVVFNLISNIKLSKKQKIKIILENNCKKIYL